MLVNQPIYFFVHLCVTLYKGSNKTNVEKFSEFDTFWHKLHRKVRVVLLHNYKEISSRELKHLGLSHYYSVYTKMIFGKFLLGGPEWWIDCSRK